LRIELYTPEVRVIGVTMPVVDYIPDSEGLISHTARASAPQNQNDYHTADRLLSYCAREGHWSVFSMANAVIEIKAPRDISRQILRHKSADFQEFSQRYAEVDESMFVLRATRLQDTKNRQNSIEVDDEILELEWEVRQEEVIHKALQEYQWALSKGIAKECARVVLPEGNTMSRMYMNATMRTWLHYCQLRGGNGTQLEHTWVSEKCRECLKEYFPNLVKFMEGVK
jgi:thymidylate synthase (FAD)